LIFGLIFKVLPDVRISWRDVWQGAFVTAILFVIGQELISLYFSLAGVASAYGASGSLLAPLLRLPYVERGPVKSPRFRPNARAIVRRYAGSIVPV